MTDSLSEYVKNSSSNVEMWRGGIRYTTTITDTTFSFTLYGLFQNADNGTYRTNWIGAAFEAQLYYTYDGATTYGTIYDGNEIGPHKRTAEKGKGFYCVGSANDSADITLQELGNTDQVFYLSHTFSRETQDSAVVLGIHESNSVSGDESHVWHSVRITIPALESATLTYSANGGMGAPDAQTMYKTEDSVISSTVPTRTGNVGFQGWTIDSTAINKVYDYNETLPTCYAARSIFRAAGSAVVNTTLYAVWKSTYVMPAITNLKIVRNSTTETKVDVSFGWSIFTEATVSSCILYYAENTSTPSYNTKGITLIGTSGSYSSTITDITFDETKSYLFYIVLTDNNSKSFTTSTLTLGTGFRTLYFKNGGRGVGIGSYITDSEVSAHTTNGLLKVGMDTLFQVDGIWNALLDIAHPIGSYLFTSVTTSPSEYIGGNWTPATYMSGMYVWQRVSSTAQEEDDE